VAKLNVLKVNELILKETCDYFVIIVKFYDSLVQTRSATYNCIFTFVYIYVNFQKKIISIRWK